MTKFLWIIVVVFLVSCQNDRLNVDVSAISVDLKLKRYDQLFFASNPSNLAPALQNAYSTDSSFIDLYTADIIRIGLFKNEDFYHYLDLFRHDTVIAQVADTVLKTFYDFQYYSTQLEKGFQHLKYYFPEAKIPTIYTYVSGFNQSLVVSNDGIGIGLDKYLGSDCIFYKYLGIPQYKIKNMYPDKLVPDVFYAWALTEYPKTEESNNLLSEMIHEGKLLYFTEAMCPDLPDSVIIGYSAAQLSWCRKNEAQMWSYWAEHRLLYSVERLDLQKYVGDAPFTNTFSNESPGRTGVWTGWQIVRSYMNQHPELSLEMLMTQGNAQELLAQSRYFPE
ncbi:MAG: hypothetical protein ACERKD_17550 [Prolixibacteraceae bacterium]